MTRFNMVPILATGTLMGVLGFAGLSASAEQTRLESGDINKVKSFIDTSGINLADAIKKAEQECNGKAIQAMAMCNHAHDQSGTKTDHYRVACLTKNNEVVEVCVDSRNGSVLGTHESKVLPVSFRQATLIGDGTSPDVAVRVTKTEFSTNPLTRPLRVQKATDLIGKPVENARGEKLGEVQDLAIDPDHGGRVAYVVLSFGGFMGMGEKWFAIPTRAMNLPNDAKAFILPLEKDRLKNATGFDKDRWPTMGNTAWATGLHEFYDQKPYWMDGGEGSTPSALRILKASEIIGKNVQNERNEGLGEVKDLVIDPDRFRVMYGVLSFGGFLGVGDKLFAVPMGAIRFPEGANAVLPVDKDRLKNATGFDKNQWPNLADPTFARTTYEFYGQRPFWTD